MQIKWSSFFAGYAAGIVTVIVLVVAGLFIAANLFREQIVARQTARLQPPAMADGTMAGYDWTVIDNTGVAHPMEEFRNRSILVQFWSPDCMACESEIPAMNRLHEETKASGLEIFAVAVDVDPAKLNEIAVEKGITYPIYALSGTVPEVFKFQQGPATFVINPAGTIVMRHVGAAKWDDPGVVAWLKLVGSGTEFAQ